MEKRFIETVRNLGLSDKAAKAYLAALELGEATVQDIARHAGIARTSIYYTLKELRERGALLETKRNKKIYYIAAEPREVLKLARERVWDFEDNIEELEERRHAVYKKPRVYFLYGPQGFKQVWDMIFKSPSKQFSIITEGANFLDFVKERYIIDEIITTKKALGVKSRQLIVDSAYAQKIVAKDTKENRESRLLPAGSKLPFTEIITDRFVAFISPRWDNTLFVIENENFALTRSSAFDLLWTMAKK